ncbi:MAG: hypothetical protein V4486_01210 [Patescibacteria group bacterium]
MLPEYTIFIGVILFITGYYIYTRDMFKGATRPNLVSWFIWTLAPFIASYFQLKAGARFSVLPVFLAGFGPLLVIIASFWSKNKYWKLSLFDIICGTLALLSLLLYIVTQNLAISIIFAILADAWAFVPTIKKSWTNPESETGILYFFAIISNIIGLLVIKDWSFTIYSFGAYLVVANIIIVFVIYRKNIFPQKEIISQT